jgi:hypothetical protein
MTSGDRPDWGGLTMAQRHWLIGATRTVDDDLSRTTPPALPDFDRDGIEVWVRAFGRWRPGIVRASNARARTTVLVVFLRGSRLLDVRRIGLDNVRRRS